MRFTSCRCSLIILLAIFTALFLSCNKTDTAVSKPIPDCYDNIQNQGEQGVDCGGPCVPCPGKMMATIDGQPWETIGPITSSVLNNSIFISGSSSNSTISLIYNGPFSTGTYNLQSALYTNPSGIQYSTTQGTISFSEWNQEDNLVFGSFSFNGYQIGGSDTVFVTSGAFQSVPF